MPAAARLLGSEGGNVMLSKKKQFIATLSVILAAGFVATSLVSYFVAHDSLTEQIAESTLPLTSDNIYSEIQQDLLKPSSSRR